MARMQTRQELYATLDYHDYEALDASLVKTVVTPPGPGALAGDDFFGPLRYADRHDQEHFWRL